MSGSALPPPLRRPSGRDRRHALRLWLRGLLLAAPLERLRRPFLPDLEQWQALAAYRGLVQQAFRQRPFAPHVSADVWYQSRFQDSAGRSAFFNPAQRELEPSSHHYGHDVQLKRHAGLPLIGPALPWLLEHGLKVSRDATFESPRSWTRGYLCMGPLRAKWLRERFGVPAVAIGPWISYARSLLDGEAAARLRHELGPTLLVVLAHSWDQVERRMDRRACIEAVARQAGQGGYRSVIWLRHWKDPLLELPPEWIVACNGHRSNPWFLDALRTLLELSDGMASNAFGTHLGYGVALGLRLHWIPVEAEQDLTALAGAKAEEEAAEWAERQRLSDALRDALALPAEAGGAAVRSLLDPYWGFACVRPAEALRALLRGSGAPGA
ncbi:MAG: hypothetical protein VKK43_08785 [Synechococcaceae cyanobacterium]|nr:hypothetical protein [Synechococcaceae cyanobacterium]